MSRPLALSLIEAERQLVGAALWFEHGLSLGLSILPPHPFRSTDAAYLDPIFYILVGIKARGAWDSRVNEQALLTGSQAWAPDLLPEERAIILESLWTPEIAVPEYIERLCRGLLVHLSLEAALAASVVEPDVLPESHWKELVLGSPHPAQLERRGIRGGV